MDEATFDKLGRAELEYLEECFDDVDPDQIDYTTSDGVLTLELSDGVRVVINTHRAAQQIWMAAVDTAWHFDFIEKTGRWQTSDGQELRGTLSGVVKDRIGVTLAL